MRLVHLIFAICLFTASFDIILVFHLGASLHLAQALSLLVILAALARMVQSGSVLWPRGGTALLLWVGVQAAFLPLSGELAIGLQFFALLILIVAGFYAVVQLYGQSPRIESLMRAYLASFVFVGLFGLAQFVMPLVGLPGLLVRQWLVHGRLARINGFNYEPSYFATYMMMGWVTLIELRHSRAAIAQGRLWKVAAIILTLALFLSSSKSGWAVMGIEITARLVPVLWRALRNTLRQIQNGQMRLPLPSFSVIAGSLVGLLVLGFALRSVTRLINPLILLNGTGLGGTAAHSYNERSELTELTLAEFADNPWVGRGLGGANVALGARVGIHVVTMEEATLHWGFPVLGHVLLASGVFGFIPFLVFLYTYTVGAVRLSSRYWPQECAKWVRALARAMIMEWIILMSDQNLLRVYLWFHFAIMAAVMYHLEFSAAREPASSPQEAPFLLPHGALADPVPNL